MTGERQGASPMPLALRIFSKIVAIGTDLALSWQVPSEPAKPQIDSNA
jgi:hypothetical protein